MNEQALAKKKYNPMNIAGGTMIILSGGVLIATELAIAMLERQQELMGWVLNSVVAGGYLLAIFLDNRSLVKLTRIKSSYTVNFLILASMSCFVLNYSIPVFQRFADWLIILFVFFYAALFALRFHHRLNRLLKLIVSFSIGLGVVPIAYFAFVLVPTYPIALIGLPLLGFTLHLFIPMIVLICTLYIWIKHEKTSPDRTAFGVGLIIPLMVIGGYLTRYSIYHRAIHKASAASVTSPQNTLPRWVLLCQNVPSDGYSRNILMGDMVFDDLLADLFGAVDGNALSDKKRHDPLVAIARGIFGELDLTRAERIKILRSQYDVRHDTQRKLWSEKDLGTTEVLNRIKVFPDFRIAYTEKTITVRNHHRSDWNQQEASYTFYLPEGSVATSLSLWIDGKEEPSRLTSKSRADSAYTTIVGRERRDPALLHWQEGNTLTVTVFPCTPSEDRKFKIGITTPLMVDGDRLTMPNVYFDGPIKYAIQETSVVEFAGETPLEGLDLPSDFVQDLDGKYLSEGRYLPDWSISFDKMPLSDKAFSFNGKSYRVLDADPADRDFSPNDIYLDLHKGWSKREFDRVRELFKGKKMYCHTDRMIEITDANQQRVFSELSERNFSLFPFHLVQDVSHSLIVSQSADLGPGLAELADSKFMEVFSAKLATTDARFNVFHLGEEMSLYLKSLQELQVMNLEMGDLRQLAKRVETKRFVLADDAVDRVSLVASDMVIKMDKGDQGNGAPDHLMRLFAYNQIMKQLGKRYFGKDDRYIDELVGGANEAYVVSPVSSLIVLESKKDYDRFGIDENKNSLKNASMDGDGSVPEPHEWVMIVIALLLMVYLYKRLKMRPAL